MQPENTHTSDWSLLQLIKEDNAQAWESLYTKYSGLMYGCILKITSSEKISNKIFKSVFLDLRHVPLPDTRKPFAFWLWQFTGTAALDFMKKHNITLQPGRKTSPLELVCFNKNKAISNTASAMLITETELRNMMQELNRNIA